MPYLLDGVINIKLTPLLFAVFDSLTHADRATHAKI